MEGGRQTLTAVGSSVWAWVGLRVGHVGMAVAALVGDSAVGLGVGVVPPNRGSEMKSSARTVAAADIMAERHPATPAGLRTGICNRQSDEQAGRGGGGGNN